LVSSCKKSVLFMAVLILMILSGFIFGGCDDKAPLNEHPNILLIVLDTVRADHLSCYGHTVQTTPNIDRLAEEGAKFTNVYSTSCWTLPAHASIFTGKYPYTHGAHQKHLHLNNSHLTSAEALESEGYQTVFFSDNPMVGKGVGLAQGFEDIYHIWMLRKNKDKNVYSEKMVSRYEKGKAHPVNKAVETWWKDKKDDDRPFFMFINYIDAHGPYKAPEKYVDDIIKDRKLKKKARSLPQGWPAFYSGKIKYDKEDFQLLSLLYDAEIKYLDFAVNELLSFLKSNDRLENTAIIITSDHGESLGEHGLVDHVFNLYNTNLRVPLIVYYPPLFKKNSKCDRPVQLNDLFRTCLDLSGKFNNIDTPTSLSLLPQNWNNIAYDRTLFSEYYFPEQALGIFSEEALKSGKLDKYKRSLESVIKTKEKAIKSSTDEKELYLLEKDPAEKNNLYDENKGKFEKLMEVKTGFKERIDKVEYYETPVEFDEETKDRLRDLGYIK